MRHRLPELADRHRVISIHAPAWGATHLPDQHRHKLKISIHAPAWGATSSTHRRAFAGTEFQSTHPRGVRPCSPTRRATRSTHFNPRTRVGCDPLSKSSGLSRCRISIHAPAWGATKAKTLLELLLIISIHAPAWGATVDDASTTLLSQSFQSTHPRGVRPRFCDYSRLTSEFQSTHPRGVRQAFDLPVNSCPMISIHAPAWGATPKDRQTLTITDISIHAPAWGATSFCAGRRSRRWNFNPRTRVGCDDYSGANVPSISF